MKKIILIIFVINLVSLILVGLTMQFLINVAMPPVWLSVWAYTSLIITIIGVAIYIISNIIKD